MLPATAGRVRVRSWGEWVYVQLPVFDTISAALERLSTPMRKICSSTWYIASWFNSGQYDSVSRIQIHRHRYIYSRA